MITREFLLNKYKKEYGLTLVPLKHTTRLPQSKWTGKYKDDGTKEYSWKKSKGITFSDEELLAARSWGVDHEASGTLDIDFDDKLFHAHKFKSMLPDTHSVGKMLNGSGIPTTNHLLYFKPENVEVKTESYPKTIRGKGEKIIELLPNTQSRYVSDHLYITHDIPPKRLTESEFQLVRQATKEIYFMAMASQHYPPKNKKQRDEYIMRLFGALVQHTDWTTSKREDIATRLLKANNDTDELNNRLNKIKKQENQLREGKNVYGIPALVDFIGADKKTGLDWIDVIKPDIDLKLNKELVTLKLGDFLVKAYPPTEYLQFPITAKGKLVQVWANAGHGKTWFCLEWACSIANGQDFLKWKYPEGKEPEAYPVLYVEGEMSVSELQDRLLSISQRYQDEGKEFNRDNFYIAPLREQHDQTFESLTNKAGRAHVENTAKRIFRETGKKPFIFLDNITALTVMQEKEGADWVELVHWLNKLRAQDYSVIFLHHGTKAGDTSSGSNLKERSIDISIHLSIPEDKELLELDDEKNTQIKIKFDKWREFNFTKHSKPFIAVLNRDTTTWSFDQLLTEKQRKVKQLHDSGLSAKEIVAKIKDVSQAQVYRILKMFKQEGKNEII